MKKVLLAAIVALISACFVLTACTPQTNNGNKEYEIDLDVAKSTTATISVLVPADDYEEDLINSVIDGFNEIFPNVTVNISNFQYNSYESTILQQLQGKILPDILWTNSTDYLFLCSKNLALPLETCFDASEDAGVFDIEDDFYKEYFDMGKYKNKTYFIPRSVDTNVTFINTEVFAAAGVDMNPATTKVKNGWSWQDFMDTCATVRAYYDGQNKGNFYPIDPNFEWESVYYAMMRAYGADFFDADGKIVVDSAATAEVGALIKEMVTKRYVPDTATTAGSSYESGTGAMLFQSAGIARMDEKAVLHGKVDLVSFPLINVKGTPKIGCGTAGYAINSGTKNLDICWQFLNYMLTKAGQEDFAYGGLTLPSIRQDLADPMTAKWGENYRDKNLEAYLYGNEYKMVANFFNQFDAGKKSDILLATSTMMQNFRDTTKTVPNVISTCKTELGYAIED